MNYRNLSFDKNQRKQLLIRSQPYISKYKIVPEWRKDESMVNVEPVSCKQQLFIVKRKQEIQKNRWKSIIKQISSIQEDRDKNYDQFKRKVKVKLSRSNQGKFLKYLRLEQSQSQKLKQNTHESFRKQEMFKRLVLRTQPYWKKFLQK